MRTTLDIEPDVLDLARSLADARRVSVGKALSWLARKGAEARTPLASRNGFAVFPVFDPDFRFGPDEVQAALDAEDLEGARNYLSPSSPAYGGAKRH
jgi:hypothetical protein